MLCQYPNRPTAKCHKSGSGTVVNGRPLKKWEGEWAVILRRCSLTQVTADSHIPPQRGASGVLSTHWTPSCARVDVTMSLCLWDEGNSCISSRDRLASMKFVPLSLNILLNLPRMYMKRRKAVPGVWQRWPCRQTGKCSPSWYVASQPWDPLGRLDLHKRSQYLQMEGLEWHARRVNQPFLLGGVGWAGASNNQETIIDGSDGSSYVPVAQSRRDRANKLA